MWFQEIHEVRLDEKTAFKISKVSQNSS